MGGPERYRVMISGSGAAREWDVDEAFAVYAEADRTFDFPAGGDALIEVAQVGANGLPGAWVALEVTIPAP